MLLEVLVLVVGLLVAVGLIVLLERKLDEAYAPPKAEAMPAPAAAPKAEVRPAPAAPSSAWKARWRCAASARRRRAGPAAACGAMPACWPTPPPSWPDRQKAGTACHLLAQRPSPFGGRAFFGVPPGRDAETIS